MEAVEKAAKRRGRPKKAVEAIVEAVKTEVKETPKPTEPDARMDNAFELPEGVDVNNISVTSMKRVSLSDPNFDPFTKFKTDPKMYYRAINNRSHNVTKREAEGYKLIPEAKYGDLVLGCMPKELRASKEAHVREKTANQTQATSERFKEEADRSGIKTYEEK